MAEKLKIALIGCGFFGSQLASAFHKAGADLLAVMDINPTFAQNLAAQYDCRAFLNTEEMLSSVKPDLAIIATPNYAHYSPAILALNAGCHLFIDTPFTLSAAHCQHLEQLAKEKGKQIFVGHLLRTLPGILKVKEALEQGKLGKITVTRAMRQRWIDNVPNKEWWKLDANLTGGELFHQIHELDLLCWLLGDIDAVYAQSANRAHGDTPDSKDVIQLLLRFHNGVLGSLEMGTAYRLHQWGIQLHGEKGAIEINFFTSTVTFSYIDGTTEHIDLYAEFEADLSLRESAKGTQQYNATHTLCPLWLSRAAEIEAESIVAHFTQVRISPLAVCLSKAIQVAEAARYSTIVEKQISLTD
ncbi:Gfo/Idh/MocA family oxidoreductase [Aggregatibacter actinomycetemcomitans]|nr:Gfo/Idh/MocA family oxidoreductase [Aggregatibacter actinomycetemcomitans]